MTTLQSPLAQQPLRFAGQRKTIEGGIKSSMDDIKCKSQHIKGDVWASMGNVKLTDCKVNGAITSSMGNVILDTVEAGTVKNSSGNIKANQCQLSQVSASSGNVTLSQSQADNVSSSSGNVRVEDSTAGNLSTASGNVTLSRAQAKNASSSSGNVRMEDSTAGHVSTSSGNVTLTSTELSGGIKSSSGTITLKRSTVAQGIESAASTQDQKNAIIRLEGDATRVDGVIRVKESQCFSSNSFGNNIVSSGDVVISGSSMVIINGKVITGNSFSGKDASGEQYQVIEIADGAVVRGDITFDSGKGIVRLVNGGRFEGKLSGGTLESENPTPPQDKAPPKENRGDNYKFL